MVGIDIGTTKVCTLIADVTGAVPQILGVGICPAQGLRRGVVVDVGAAAETVLNSLRRAEQQSGLKALSAYVGVASVNTTSVGNRAAGPVRGPNGAITPQDVTSVLMEAQGLHLPPDQQVLHVLPHHFVVDGIEGIKNPVGMTGRRLEVVANVVTGSATAVRNLTSCVEAMDVLLDGLVPESLAAGRAILSEDEAELGVLVIDLGGGTCDAAIFHGGSMIYHCSLPVGGNQISSDLAFGLRAAYGAAEEIKLRYGSTLAQAGARGELVAVSSFWNQAGWNQAGWNQAGWNQAGLSQTGKNQAGDHQVGGAEASPIEQRSVAEIIDARLAETFELVREQILRSGYADCYPGGVVLTGGTSLIRGAASLAADVMGGRARLGAPPRLPGLADAVQGPSFATSVGLLLWGADQVAAAPPEVDGRIGRWTAALKEWFRNFV